MIYQIGVAALLAGLACGPAWAQEKAQSMACPPKVGTATCVTIDGRAAKTITFAGMRFGSSDAPPPATNLDAAWQVCEKHLNDEVNATHAVVQDDFSVPCGRVEMLLNDRRNADAAAKAKINDATDLAVIERGIDHPNKRPPR